MIKSMTSRPRQQLPGVQWDGHLMDRDYLSLGCLTVSALLHMVYSDVQSLKVLS